MTDSAALTGHVTIELVGEDGELKAREEIHNLVTAVGVTGYLGQVLASGKPALPNGMKLGTGSTAVASTGSGAALTTYLSGSAKAFDSGYPQVSGGVATYKRTYAAGEATSASPITEAVIATDGTTDATSDAAHTWARVLISGVAAKGASDTLTITWTHTLTASA